MVAFRVAQLVSSLGGKLGAGDGHVRRPQGFGHGNWAMTSTRHARQHDVDYLLAIAWLAQTTASHLRPCGGLVCTPETR